VILNTPVVTYSLLSFLSLLLGIGAMAVAVPVARKWKPERSSEEQQGLEKKVYLCMTLVTLGLIMRFALVPLWFLMLQSIVPSIPGAMCLAGVHLLKTPWSFISTILKFVVPMAYGYWLALNALDRKIETQPLMTRKLYALVPLGVLMLFESFSDLRFLSAVEPRFVNCCSSLFDDSSSLLIQKMTYSGWGWVAAYAFASIALVAVCLFLWRSPRHPLGATLWALGPATLIAFVLAVHTRLSPILLHAQFHHCVFCVWQKLPDMIVATAATCIACWSATIFASTRNVHDVTGAAAVADANARTMLKWAIGSQVVACAIVAFRLVARTG
jgi:hypothetical protein